MDKVYPELASADVVVFASPGVYAGIEGQYKGMVAYFQAEDLGIRELNGDANKTEAALADIEAFGASIK